MSKVCLAGAVVVFIRGCLLEKNAIESNGLPREPVMLIQGRSFESTLPTSDQDMKPASMKGLAVQDSMETTLL